MSSTKTIWLKKSDAIHGPFNSEQVEALRMTGVLSQYSHIKQSDAEDWKALGSDEATTQSAAPAPQPLAPVIDLSARAHARARAQAAASYGQWEILVHDFRHAISGKILKLNDEGCDLISDTPTSDPCFGMQATVVLNLLDSRSGGMHNVKAKIESARRTDGKWIYKIRWPEIPEALAA